MRADSGSFDKECVLAIDLSDKEAKAQVEGHDIPMKLGGRVELRALLKASIETVQAGPARVPKPGALPQVTGSFPTKVDLKAEQDEVAKRIFAALSPQEALRCLPGVGPLVADAYKPHLEGAFDRLKGDFKLDSWPHWNHSAALQDHLRHAFDTACRPARTNLIEQFGAKLMPALGDLRDALMRIADKEVDSLGEHVRKAVELLVLIGHSRQALLDRVGAKLGDALRTAADPARIKTLWDHAGWLVALAIDAKVGLAKPLMTRFLVAAKDGFDKHREQADRFLQEALRALHGRGVNVLAFSEELLVSVRDTAGASPQHAKFFVDLVVGSASAAANAAQCQLAPALGAFLGVFLIKDASPDALLAAFVERMTHLRKLTKDEAMELLRHVGDEEMLRKVCAWIHANWDRFRAIISEGLEQLKEYIEFVLGFLKQPLKLPQELEDLKHLLHTLAGVGKTLLRAPEFLNFEAHLASIERVFKGGIHRWLHEEAKKANTTVAQFAKDFITKTNALVAFLDKIGGAAKEIFGQVDATAGEVMERWKLAVHKLEELNRKIWNIIFAGELGQSPMFAVYRYEGLLSEPLDVPGATIEVCKTIAQPDRVKAGEYPVIPLPSGLAPDMTFVAAELYLDKLKVPHPCEMRPMRWEAHKPPKIGIKIPLGPLAPWDFSEAIAHLPEFWVIDMRYHMPYGDVGLFRTADLDKDGFVRSWEVEAVRKAVTTGEYRLDLDCDGDGKVTADDLQLAIEQQSRLVNGIMYRPTTGPLGFWYSYSPYDWFFTAFGALTDESIEGKVHRDGIITVIDGQVVIPLINYPIRYHYEGRYFIDRFPALALLPGLAPATPSTRHDIVVRGGRTGRDWQLYFTTEPLNPMLRTWVLRATIYARALLTGGLGLGTLVGAATGAGVAGKGDVRIQVVYETSAPLIAVVQEWHDRIKNLSETKPQDLPIPFDFFKSIFEYTDVPRLCRALIQIAGPFVDLLFDWCDEGHRVRAALGYIRTVTLNRWRPAPTWEELRFEVSQWPATEVPAPEREAVLAAIAAVQKELSAADEDAVYTPAAIAKRVQDAVAKIAPPVTEARAAPKEEAVPAKEAKEAVPAKEAKGSRIDEKLKALLDDRGRFAAGFDQLAPDPDAKSVRIPLCGKFEIRNPKMVAVPFAYKDVKNLQEKKQEATIDDVLAVRGNPFYKPIYHSMVEFGSDAQLCTAPDEDLFFEPVGAGTYGIVEGSRVLEDERGHWWLWIRLESWRHGWLRLDREIVERVFSKTGDAERAAKSIEGIVKDAAKDFISQAVDPRLVDELEKLGEQLRGKQAITRVEASPRDTVDETRYARIARAALARARVGRNAPGDRVKPPAPGLPATGLLDVFEDSLNEVKTRVFGLENRDQTDEKLAETFNSLSAAKREKLWAATASWLKLRHYTPIITEHLIHSFIPLILQAKFEEAWKLVLAMMRKAADFPLEEALVAVQSASPAIKEVVLTLIDMGMKLKSIKDMIATGEGDIAGAGEIGPAGAKGKPTFKDAGMLLARLLIDDEEEPGRPPPPPSDGKSKDLGIKFSFSASVKNREPKPGDEQAAGKRTPNEWYVLLAEPAVGSIHTPKNLEKMEVGQEYELQVGQWAALVHSNPKQLVLSVDPTRIPEDVKAKVEWRVFDGKKWSVLREKGARITFKMSEAYADAEELTFEAYLGQPVAEGVERKTQDEWHKDAPSPAAPNATGTAAKA